ncbi:RNA-directed DNA polymerase [Bradyrhizobium japonicum]|uniref:reverse transcriptase domain-containing protein n=1 Tax=Bradyrhizobium ottawaense TaxID=931866 RepID=UPI0034781EA0
MEPQAYIAAAHSIVVDIDLEKFFDRVNHDILMGLVAKRVADKRILKLIRAFLNAGVLEGGLVSPTEEGTPQGGPLSPLLSNLMLDVLDKELEKRGHRFVRYADDCNIYVRSQRAGERVLAGVERFLEKRLKLKINKAKSAVAKPSVRPASFNSRRRHSPAGEGVTRRTRGRCLVQIATVELVSKSAPLPGSNGSMDPLALPSCDAAASAGIWRRKPPAAHVALGGSRTAPRSPLLCPNGFFASLGLASVAARRPA